MFLTRLSEREKELFMELATAVVKADGKVDNAELISLNYYAMEMGVNFEFEKTAGNVDDILAELKASSSDEIKRVFVLELLALAFADKEYVDAEESLMKKICGALGIENASYYKSLYMVIDYLSDLNKMGQFIEKGI